MKKATGLILVLLMLASAGCRKQATVYACKNQCYTCYAKTDILNHFTLCNTDFSNREAFEMALFDDSISGNICNEVQPTIFTEYTGNAIPTAMPDTSPIRCYELASIHPHYFNYPAFVALDTACWACSREYADSFIVAYVATLDTLCGFCSDCVQYWQVDTARARALVKANKVTCIKPNQFSGWLNIRQIVRDMQFQPVSATFTQQDKNKIITLNSWFDFNPLASPGTMPNPQCKM